MGMFDYYIPQPELKCPVCGKQLREWQGKDAHCALFTWKQGLAHPLEISDEKWRASERPEATLPTRFEIYTDSCGCPCMVTAFGRCADGIWVETELVTAQNIDHYIDQSCPKAERTKMIRWLNGKRV